MNSVLHLIETYWWLWFLGLIVSILGALASGFFLVLRWDERAMMPAYLFGLTATFFKILFVIALIIKILKYAL